MESLFVPLSLLAGGLLAVQAGANAQLSKAVGSPFAATTLQLGIGTGLLFLVALLTGTLAVLGAVPQAEWWHLAGGTASAVYVVSTILLFPRLGAVVSVGLFIAGQMLASLALDSFGLLGVMQTGLRAGAAIGTLTVLAGVGLIVFGVVFALNSAVHSYLILAYAEGDKVAMNVGFYYMANAGGRLAGTVLSGALYQWQGLEACLWGSVVFVLAAGTISLLLPQARRAPSRAGTASAAS